MKKRLILLMLAIFGFSLASCDLLGSDEPKDPENPGNNNPPQEVEYTFASFSNPVQVVYPNGSPYLTEVADPSIVRGDDGYFYIFSTLGRVLRSEDACTWERFSDGIIPRPTWESEVYGTPVNAQIWAPDVIKIGDKWIYYYSLSGWGSCCGIGYAVADQIAGPYTDMGKLFDYKEIGIDNAIDPHVFIDDDGSVYMSVGSFQGLFLLELTEDGMELKGGVAEQCETKTLIAGKVGGWDGSTYEGSYIIKKDGYYYYFGSPGTCCDGANSTYRVVVGRAEEIHGPYVDKKGRPLTASGNGMTFGEQVLNTGIGNKNMVGAGHNSILVDDAGDYWIYYHAYSADDNWVTRHLFMDKLDWDDDGFPYVSYTYENDEGEIKNGKVKPSYHVELDGPRFVLE